MELSLLLIIIGIVLAILVHYALGIVCILIGLVLLIWPRISGACLPASLRPAVWRGGRVVECGGLENRYTS
jgi:hypothetical protein